MKKYLNFLKRRKKEKTFFKEFEDFRDLPGGDRFPLSWDERKLIDEKTSTTKFDRHYIYHPAWAARILKRTQPEKHIDISSILHFPAIVSAFIPIEFYDYRPADLELSNLTSKKADLLSLPFEDNSVGSLSCMHVIEHIGLGRYGDPLDPEADVKAVKELIRVLAPGGNLLFVTPMGKSRIMFNAHRIYSHKQIIEMFGDLTVQEFSFLPDSKNGSGLIPNASPEFVDEQSYGMGCFWFKKK